MKTILMLGGVIAVALAGTALGQSEGPTVINACKHPSGGWLRQVHDATQCRRRETAVSWNVAGEKGEKGDPGPSGPARAAGTERRLRDRCHGPEDARRRPVRRSR
jgi:hypothetical protein